MRCNYLLISDKVLRNEAHMVITRLLLHAGEMRCNLNYKNTMSFEMYMELL